MKRDILLIIFLFGSLVSNGQAPDCANATPFCTSSGLTYPASTGASSPSGPNYGCLGTQPNPAFFVLQIDNPGSLTLSLSSAPANDIDFICWGPFADPNTMCNNLTAGNTEDCSYSPTWNETCQINNASVGDYYVILITNFSNSPCNINFTQTGGTGSTDCCIAGDAGNNNSIDLCETDPNFNMQSQLAGNPDNGGDWYNSNWVSLSSNTFNPSINSSGTYAYIVQGNVVSGASIPCPSDTSYLTVNVNPSPIVNIPPFTNLCDNDQTITLSTATPIGGTYIINGSNTTTFTPSILNVGINIIDYTFTDVNGCSAISTQNLIVDASPFATGVTTNASCSGYTDGSATLNPSTSTISSYAWSDGQTTQTANNLTAGIYSYTVTDINGCIFSDSIIIYEPGGINATLNTTNIKCNGDANGTISVNLQGTSSPPGNISLLSYCTSTSGSSTNSTIDNIQLIGDNYNINNNTTGICDQYEDYTNLFSDVTEGQSYNIDISLGDCSNNYPSGGKVFIDWNIDGDFNDPGENVGTIPISLPSTTTITFTVPFSGAYGATRMRIVSQFLNNTLVSSVGPCDIGVMANPIYIQPWFGATEDYSIVVNSATVSANYLWSNFATTDSISNLSIGTYTVDITDQNGCVITESVTLTEPEAISVSEYTSNVSCNNGNNGGITLVMSGGSPDYSISLPPYSLNLINGDSIFTTPQILIPGNYGYIITDSNSCTYSSQVSLMNPNQISTLTTTTACDNLLWNGTSYNSTGTYVDTLMNINGCDSIIILNLTINNSVNSYNSETECDTYTWNGNTYTTSGLYDSLFTNSSGCDSLASLNLIINNSSSSFTNNTACDSFTWGVSNQTYNTSGVFIEVTTNASGCLHTDSLNLIINYTADSTSNISSCDSYNWNGNNYYFSGFYIDTLSTYLGCDSIATLNLTITDTTSTYLPVISCDSFVWPLNGQIYTSSIVDTIISVNANGCPHIDILLLTINNSNSSIDIYSACDSTTWIDGITYSTTNNISSFTSTNSYACDSIIYLDLTIYNSTSSYLTENSCNTYNWTVNNQTYNASGVYIYTTTNSNGCIHTDTLNLIINSPTSSSGNIFECNSYLWNGVSYSNSGIYNDTLTNIYGCDSIATINLTISDTSHLTTKMTECNAYLWSVNNITYNSSGTYIEIGTNTSNGCVHVDSLILTINNANYSNDTIITCDTYTWNSNTYSVSGDYSITFTNSLGCDSIAYLNLTINNSTSSSFSISECDSYTWDGTAYNSSGTYIKNFLTSNGCDSVVTLDLTVINGAFNISVIINSIDINCYGESNGAINLFPSGGISPFSYMWSNGEITQNISNLSAGQYDFTITDSIGCTLDSSTVIIEPEQIFLDFIATSPICRNDESTLSINISNTEFNSYTVSLQDSILKTYIIDTNGLLIVNGMPIILTPNFSCNPEIIALTDENGCTTVFNDNVHIEVKQLPVLEINQDDICNGTPSFILDNATPIGGTYFIEGIQKNYFDVENLAIGPYVIKYKFTDILTNCSNSLEETININPSPLANFSYSPLTVNILEPTIHFIGLNNNDIVYSEWNIGSENITIFNEYDFYYDFKDTGSFIINYYVSNIYNCLDSTSKNITIYPRYESYFPTAFTPNNDGNNDIFKPKYSGIESYKMYIFNRWGELVFKGENIGWDGTQNGENITNGIYSYSVEVLDFKNKPFIYTGTVNLIR
ncbi:gliding motility-associated C-terminal domain-containing protein [Flavobacteriales bacterium]|nr:gliding motility-associated C-terminal domain-containing protein [Flavobacteriales bacterium]